MRTRLPLILWVVGVLAVSLLGGGALLLTSRFVVRGHDFSQEEIVGVITTYGLPFPFASDAPGYAWAQINGSAATWDYWIFVVLVALGCLLFQSCLVRLRSTA